MSSLNGPGSPTPAFNETTNATRDEDTHAEAALQPHHVRLGVRRHKTRFSARSYDARKYSLAMCKELGSSKAARLGSATDLHGSRIRGRSSGQWGIVMRPVHGSDQRPSARMMPFPRRPCGKQPSLFVYTRLVGRLARKFFALINPGSCDLWPARAALRSSMSVPLATWAPTDSREEASANLGRVGNHRPQGGADVRRNERKRRTTRTQSLRLQTGVGESPRGREREERGAARRDHWATAPGITDPQREWGRECSPAPPRSRRCPRRQRYCSRDREARARARAGSSSRKWMNSLYNHIEYDQEPGASDTTAYVVN
ncbi:hypothetical protein C8Q77DRAFT_740623 [Trametes polyzona]|nr:hypothetical protein C8Q77DRAFT_740623 [Trametes polyzona]